MFESLVETVRGWLSTTRKDTVLTSLDVMFSTIQDDVMPAFQMVLDSKNLEEVKKCNFYTVIYKNCGIVASDNYQALVKMSDSFQLILNNKVSIRQLVTHHMQDTLTNKAMSAKTAAILTFLQDIQSMSTYMLDLLYYIVADEKHSDLPRVHFKRLKDGGPTFINLYRVYGFNITTTIDNLSRVSDEIIKTESEIDTKLNNIMLSKTGKVVELPQVNFVGNPIYHFRMWLVDRDTKKYEAIKVKKQLIELKLMELKLKQEDDHDPALSKQIKYYEEKLASLEYSIEKFEKE